LILIEGNACRAKEGLWRNRGKIVADIASFYDKRVGNPTDLNARSSDTLARPAHHHAGIVRIDETVPDDTETALVWLYRAEESLCDLLWHVIASLSQHRPQRLLDLGCGEGGTVVRFYELSPNLEIVGITLSEKQSEIAKRNCPPGQFVTGDMLTVEPPAQCFDVVYAIESTEYLGSPGLACLMERASKWVIPDGLLVVIAGSRSPSLFPDDPVVWAFDAHYKTRLSSSNDYRRLAATCGFKMATELDLAPVTLPYWRARRDCLALRNSTDGAVEALIAQVLEDGRGEYHLWAWYRGSEP
jgi:SAM-dependent methyltransferase